MKGGTEETLFEKMGNKDELRKRGTVYKEEVIKV